MEAGQFDALTRAVANRRSMLGRLGAGGLSRCSSCSSRSGGGQNAGSHVSTISRSASAWAPPQRGAGRRRQRRRKLKARLTVVIGDGGTMTDSKLTLADRSSSRSSAKPRATESGARVALEDDRYLVLQGVGDQRIDSCKGRIDGSLIGPLDGDLGDWHAIARRHRRHRPRRPPRPDRMPGCPHGGGAA